MFDKSSDLFPIKKRFAFLSSCGISPLYQTGYKREMELERSQMEMGSAALAIFPYPEILDNLHSAAAVILGTVKENLSFTKSTAEGLCMIANGYPLAPGDEIVSYVHEYPANHYPWKLQERRGAKLVLLPDTRHEPSLSGGRPTGWSMSDLEAAVTKRTRIVAVSHVQYTSGFAADLAALGAFCKERRIDLIVDAAQSLGCLPIVPEEHGIAAVAASGWKWLMGPIGSGLLYTSPDLRSKLEITMAGAPLMKQGEDYLDHSWNPRSDGGMFEYSTVPLALAMALEASLTEVFCRYGVANISTEICRLQRLALEGLEGAPRLAPLLFDEPNRSGILSLVTTEPAEEVAKAAFAKGVLCTARGGYLRFAPHYYLDDGEVERAVDVLRSL